MSLKKYKICRLAIIVILSISISISLSLENYYLPIIFVLSASFAMYYCRKQLRTEKVMVDERDYQVAGQAARYTLYIFGWLGAISTFVLMALSKNNQSLFDLSQFIAISVCVVLLLNALIFKYLSKKN